MKITLLLHVWVFFLVSLFVLACAPAPTAKPVPPTPTLRQLPTATAVPLTVTPTETRLSATRTRAPASNYDALIEKIIGEQCGRTTDSPTGCSKSYLAQATPQALAYFETLLANYFSQITPEQWGIFNRTASLDTIAPNDNAAKLCPSVAYSMGSVFDCLEDELPQGVSTCLPVVSYDHRIAVPAGCEAVFVTIPLPGAQGLDGTILKDYTPTEVFVYQGLQRGIVNWESPFRSTLNAAFAAYPVLQASPQGIDGLEKRVCLDRCYVVLLDWTKPRASNTLNSALTQSYGGFGGISAESYADLVAFIARNTELDNGKPLLQNFQEPNINICIPVAKGPNLLGAPSPECTGVILIYDSRFDLNPSEVAGSKHRATLQNVDFVNLLNRYKTSSN